MKKGLLAVAAMVVMSGLVYAQGVAGKWTGEQPGRGGNPGQPITLELKVSGSTVTGTMKTGDGDPVQISDGKVDGMKVSFTTSINRGGNDFQIMYSGEVNGDELTLMRQGGGGGGGGGGGRGGGGGGRGGGGGGGGGGRGGAAPLVLKRSS
jgi:hypothetical protein